MGSSAETRAFLETVSPAHDEIHQEMATYADDHGFPIIGPEAGGVLRSLACATNAHQIFEFGSGFGYSAYWFLQGMEPDGEVVLTEFDKDEIEMAEELFERAGLTNRASFEHGDAMDAVTRYDGPFDIVLIDHQKERYPDAFEAIRPSVPPGGVVIADNIMRDSVMQCFTAEDIHPDDERTQGLVEYVRNVRSDDDFHTVILPVGNGLAISTRESAAD